MQRPNKAGRVKMLLQAALGAMVLTTASALSSSPTFSPTQQPSGSPTQQSMKTPDFVMMFFTSTGSSPCTNHTGTFTTVSDVCKSAVHVVA